MESINDALIAAVKALGGSKVVGPMLWPEKMADAAQRHLLDCLNPERPAHLTPEQFQLVLRKSRQAGYHDAMDWLLQELGYQPPVPMEPRDENAELQRQFIAATSQMNELMQRMERLQADQRGLVAVRRAAA